jgi:oligopeptide/dipeptide ABC transporter ATP-binding protein
MPSCRKEVKNVPKETSEEHAIEVEDLKKHFPLKQGFFKTLLSKQLPVVHAVDDVSFYIKRREIFGLAGESGCGKTTTGKLILRLVEPTAGKVYFGNQDLFGLTEVKMRKMRRKMQIIFQDPYESLNPRMSVLDILAEPLEIQNVTGSMDETTERIDKGLEAMGLVPPEEFLYRFPHELSGGQRQRVAIARAFILEPEFIVADEPLSMLDASIRSEVSKLILGQVKKIGCSFLYITHDIALARYLCDRMAIMYLGKIVEMGVAEDIIGKPLHPYTEALLAAVPVPDPTARRTEIVIKGEIPSPVNPPSGCRFHTRCPYVMDVCKIEEPKLVEISEGRQVACHKYN